MCTSCPNAQHSSPGVKHATHQGHEAACERRTPRGTHHNPKLDQHPSPPIALPNACLAHALLRGADAPASRAAARGAALACCSSSPPRGAADREIRCFSTAHPATLDTSRPTPSFLAMNSHLLQHPKRNQSPMMPPTAPPEQAAGAVCNMSASAKLCTLAYFGRPPPAAPPALAGWAPRPPGCSRPISWSHCGCRHSGRKEQTLNMAGVATKLVRMHVCCRWTCLATGGGFLAWACGPSGGG